MNKNRMNFAGTFYPALEEEVLEYFTMFEKNTIKIDLDINPRAMIVPHAGYIFSGQVANTAYTLCKEIQAKRIIVIGPSHRYPLVGASVSTQSEYETPLGNLNIDVNYANTLIDKYPFLSFDEFAHMEHSTETQMPFVKKYFDTNVIEIVYEQINDADLSEVILELLEDENNFLVISTDLSHFHSLTEATILDEKCITAIDHMDNAELDDGCEACGIVGVKSLISASTKLNLESRFLEYKTSCDVTEDNTSVVGYVSFLIGNIKE